MESSIREGDKGEKKKREEEKKKKKKCGAGRVHETIMIFTGLIENFPYDQ